MNKLIRRTGLVLVNGLLLVVLIGLLVGYLIAVSDLPSRVYTMGQREYLRYNATRSILQTAPTWKLADGMEGAAVVLPSRESRVRAALDARYEEQEGVSATVYDLDFHAEYQLARMPDLTTTITTPVELFFPFPGNLETLHEVEFLVDGEEPSNAQYTTQGIHWRTELQSDEGRQITIGYQADGANSFTYGLPRDQRSDVDVAITVSGVEGSEVPRNSLPTTASEATADGEMFTWDYDGLIASRNVQLNLPTRLSFAQRVAQSQDDFRALAGLAPFLVALFLGSLAGVFKLGGVNLRLEGYLLAGCGLALFYPLLTFLSGLVGVIPGATLALLVVSGLISTFLGLAVGWGWTWWRVGLLLVIVLGFLSLGMLTPWRGLLLTGGGLLLVGTFMVLYARRPAAPKPEAPSAPPPMEAAPEEAPAPAPLPAEALHCPYCANELAEDYQFCPSCGHDVGVVRRCAECGREQFVPVELEPAYCLRCGQPLG